MINTSNGKAEFIDPYSTRPKRTGAKLDHLIEGKVPERPYIVIENNDSALSVLEGDQYILLDKEDNKEYVFRNFGHIAEIDEPKVIPPTAYELRENEMRKSTDLPPLTRYMHVLEVEVEKRLTDNNELDDYAYSLLAVDNYLKPEAHFRHRLTRLRGFDYQTITQGLIYVSRTAFGRLVNAMPVENKYDFLLYAIDRFGKLEFKNIDYIEAVDLLQQYIEQNILSQGRYLVESERILREELKESGVPMNVVGFGKMEEDDEGAIRSAPARRTYGNRNEIKDMPDLLTPQARHFHSLFYYENEKNVMRRLRESVALFQQGEDRFRDVFAKQNWPIDMRQ